MVISIILITFNFPNPFFMKHHISNISILNFKSIKNQSFDLSSYTPLVGYNNAGKTNLLEAIKWVLRKSSLPEASFNNVQEKVSMIATINGIDGDFVILDEYK